MSDIGDSAVPVVEVQPATPAPDQPESTTEGETQEGAEKVEAERTFSQADINKILAKERHQISRRAERDAQARENRIREEVEERFRASQPKPTQQTGEPVPEQFSDYESYIKARTRFEVAQEMQSIRQQGEQQKRYQAERQQAEFVNQKLSSAAKKYSDFQDVALSEDLPITQPMAAAITESDVGGEVAYWLGMNPDEADRISRLSPVRQVRAIQEIETKVTGTPSITRVPSPIRPNAGRAAGTKAFADMSYDEFAKYRSDRLRKSR